MEFSRSIEVEDCVEGSGMSVEEELVLHYGVVAADRDDLLVCSGPGELAQAGEGDKREKSPQHLDRI